MPNNDLWEGLESDFSSFFGDDSINDTPPVSDIEPDIANERQILNIFFLIDVSGSMKGTRIAQVNYAMQNIVKGMRQRDDMNSMIKIAIMEFADKAVWKTPNPVLIENYYFTSISAQPWFTSYSSAFNELEKKLHKSGFMNPADGEYFAPLILFITDGEPVDEMDYPAALDRLYKNKWFNKSARYAIAVGEESKTEEVFKILSKFTGARENVRYADEGEALCNLIEFITVRASEVQTSVVTGGGDPSEKNIFVDEDDSSSVFSSMFDSKF